MDGRSAFRLVAAISLAATTVTSGTAPAWGAAPTCAGLPATIVGTSGADTITGTPGPDVIWADAGDDSVAAGDGDDVVCGGAGGDGIDGGNGNDQIFGGLDNDIVTGNLGDDLVDGGGGDDWLSEAASDADVTINLAAGTATGIGADALANLERVSLLRMNGSAQLLTSSSTKSVIFRGSGAAEVVTDEDTGPDVQPLYISGGFGDDHYVIGRPGVEMIEWNRDESGGLDTYDVLTTAGTTRIVDNYGGLVVNGGSGQEQVSVDGFAHSRGLTGRAVSASRINTGEGPDSVWLSSFATVPVNTGPGNDWFGGYVVESPDVQLGPGDDRLYYIATDSDTPVRGGQGTDVLVGTSLNETIDLATGVWNGVLHFRNFENALGMGGNDTIRGNWAANELRGGRGADRLYGRGRGDLLWGGQGTDRADGGSGSDGCATEVRTACEYWP
jgi:Ca2+-binding RTX toxin-like protein